MEQITIDEWNRARAQETKAESYMSRPSKRAQAILEAIGDGEYTANELARMMGFGENRNAVAPRLTELANKGYVVAIGRRKDAKTGKNGVIYKKY